MKYDAVVFDFDYTLGDSTEGIVASVNYGLGKLGHPSAEREAVRKTIGLSLKETYHALTGDTSEERTVLFETYFREKADEIMVGDTRLFPDTEETLQYLKNKGVHTGIVTTKYHYRIDAILAGCQATELIGVIVGGEDVKVPKPDPEGLLSMLETWSLPKGQLLYVGDSVVDAKTAQAAGVDFAGVTTGATSKEELSKYPCVGVYGSLGELKRALFCAYE